MYQNSSSPQGKQKDEISPVTQNTASDSQATSSSDQTPPAPPPPLVSTPEQNRETIPIPSERASGQLPAAPPPLAADRPAQNPDQIPIAPLPPIVGLPEQPPSQFPTMPPPAVSIPTPGPNDNFAYVRFLHAAPDYSPVRITEDTQLLSAALPYGNISTYSRIMDGFHVVTITLAASPQTVLYQKTVPFRAREVVTMAIIRTAAGIDLLRIPDVPCDTRYRSAACIRAANLVYNSAPLDIHLSDGQTIFPNLNFKEVTNFKLAAPQRYSFYISRSELVPTPYDTDIETLQDIPVLPLFDYGANQPIVSFVLYARAGGMYTIYILGKWYNSPMIRTKIVEDF